MKDFFRLAGLKKIKEFSVGAYAALNFWGRQDKDAIKYFYDTIDVGETTRLNQGYLLLLMEKNNIEKSVSVVRGKRHLALRNAVTSSC